MDYVRLSTAARELGCSEAFLRRAEQTGKIPAAKRDHNGWRIYTRDDIAALAEIIIPRADESQPAGDSARG